MCTCSTTVGALQTVAHLEQKEKEPFADKEKGGREGAWLLTSPPNLRKELTWSKERSSTCGTRIYDQSRAVPPTQSNVYCICVYCTVRGSSLGRDGWVSVPSRERVGGGGQREDRMTCCDCFHPLLHWVLLGAHLRQNLGAHCASFGRQKVLPIERRTAQCLLGQ